MKKIILLTIVSSLSFVVFSQTGNYQSIYLSNTGDGASLLNFQTERPWMFKQVGSGALTNLQLHNYSGPNKHFQIKTDGGLHLMNQSDNYNSFFSANGGNSYIGSLGGSLGIGTNSPDETLEIGGDRSFLYDNTNGSVHLRRNSTGGWAFGYKFYGSSGTDHGGFGGYGSSDSFNYYFIGLSHQTPLVAVFPSGDVGIGTTQPSSKLEIVNMGDGAELLRLTTERPWVFRQTSTGATSQLDLHSTVSGKNFKITSPNNNRAAQFSISDDVNGSRVFLVPDGGHVSIGSTDFGTHKLAVEGSIGAREIKVEASGWSDFVFEKDYNLRTLEEVEQHINEKGHLPEIPSEAEVTENGINLGEMNAKLLQKIEELTLYLIEQNKQNQAQQAKIEQLEQKISQLEKD